MTKHRLPVEYRDTYQLGSEPVSKRLVDYTDEELQAELATRSKRKENDARRSDAAFRREPELPGIGAAEPADTTEPGSAGQDDEVAELPSSST